MNNRTLLEVMPILEELQKGYLDLAQKMAAMEKSMRKLRETLAVPPPAAVPKKQVVRRDDPDAHLGRRGVE